MLQKEKKTPTTQKHKQLKSYLSLLDAILLRHGACVELPDGFVLEEVTTADLAVTLVGSAVARLQADDVREAPSLRQNDDDKKRYIYHDRKKRTLTTKIGTERYNDDDEKK